jgi:hypothetical protein
MWIVTTKENAHLYERTEFNRIKNQCIKNKIKLTIKFWDRVLYLGGMYYVKEGKTNPFDLFEDFRYENLTPELNDLLSNTN